jgi:hypothetical protein
MARVFEALQQSSVTDPDYAGRFLKAFDFTHVIELPAAYQPRELPVGVAGSGDCDYTDPFGDEPQAEVFDSAVAAEANTEAEPLDQPEASPYGLAEGKEGGQVIVHPSAPTYRRLVPRQLQEEFRRLRSAVMLAAESQRLQIVLICSVEPGDGASFVAENLSLTLAEFDKLNVARFRLSKDTAEAADEAYEEATESYQLSLRRTELPNLREITGPTGYLTLHDLLRLCDIPVMIEKLRARFDYVLIDAPAITTHSEVALLAAHLDGVILVARKDETRHECLTSARAALQKARAKVLGVVLNRRRENPPRPVAQAG